MMFRLLLAVPALLMAALPVAAHGPGHVAGGAGASFATGFLHPLGGADHVLAMVAVGLWAALAGGRALWFWPTAFVAAMILGGSLGLVGVGMPAVEPIILVSIVLLGVCVALSLRAPLSLGAALIAFFGVFHGHAHGLEAPGGGVPWSYVVGFVTATALLHAAGVFLGYAAVRAGRPALIRTMGALSALAGLYLIAA